MLASAPLSSSLSIHHLQRSNTMVISTPLQRRAAAIATRSIFSSSSNPTSIKSSRTKTPPILYSAEPTTENDDSVTVQLLSWGRGSSGQLGGGTEEICLYPTSVASLVLPQSFRLSPLPGCLETPEPLRSTTQVGIACGLFHSSLLVGGKIWLWGKGDGGRLGFGHEDSVSVPTLNPHLDGVRAMALGGLHSVALSSLGMLYSWGYGGFGALGHSVFTRELVPRLVEGAWSSKIKHIATAGTHTAAVTEEGEVYTWGREEGDGRLGLGPGRGPDQTGGLSIPCGVKALSTPVDAVSCGGFCTMALTKEGELWNWGANSNYELGRGNKVGGWQPRPVQSLEGVKVIQIASGGFHAMALSEEGEVFSWGHGGHGQLGHSSIQSQKVPTRIEALVDERVVSIACGGSSSAAVTVDGKLFMWGNAKDSQLGVPGLPEVQTSPVEVKFLREEDGFGAHKVLSVAIGACHAMCLASRSKL